MCSTAKQDTCARSPSTEWSVTHACAVTSQLTWWAVQELDTRRKQMQALGVSKLRGGATLAHLYPELRAAEGHWRAALHSVAQSEAAAGGQQGPAEASQAAVVRTTA